MNWLFNRRLLKLGAHADPDRLFVYRLERRLRSMTGHPLSWIPVRVWAFGSLSVLSLMVGGTGVYAYTSDQVLPGHVLYPLRQSIERIEERAAVTPASKQRIHVKHLQRRLHERALIIKKTSTKNRHSNPRKDKK